MERLKPGDCVRIDGLPATIDFLNGVHCEIISNVETICDGEDTYRAYRVRVLGVSSFELRDARTMRSKCLTGYFAERYLKRSTRTEAARGLPPRLCKLLGEMYDQERKQ